MYFTYVIRCEDNSLYTGITNDLPRRMEEHFSKDPKKCAKYTKKHTAVNLEAAWKSEDRKLASKLEYNFKHITKEQKELIIKKNTLFKEYLPKLEYKSYKRISKKELEEIKKEED